MPIDIDTFDDATEFTAEVTNAERVLRFLRENDDKAFRRSEIAEATEIDPNMVSAVLARLKERNLVRHKSPYWAIGDDERIAAASSLHRDLDALDDQLGSEEMEQWREAGGDRASDERDGE